MTSIAQQTLTQLGGTRSVLAHQRRDHIELDGLLDRLPTVAGDEQDHVLMHMWRLVFCHAYAEETVLWPVIRKVLPDGEELTLQIEREHQEINELAAALDRPHAGDGDGERERVIARLIDLLRRDVRDEEDLLLPRLQQALDPRWLRSLGFAWQFVRRTAPTRPHATVSRRPPGNVLAAAPLSLIDRTRDGLDRLARVNRGPLRTGAVGLSRALAAAAGAVERMPPVRSGERSDTSTPRTQVQA